MPLLPRWRYMTEESKALSRRAGTSAAVIILGLLLFRGLLPWLLLGLVLWWLWSAIRR